MHDPGQHPIPATRLQPVVREPDSHISPRASVAGAARRLRCFIVEDSAVIRQNLVAMLEDLLPVDVVGYAEDEKHALEWLDSTEGFCDLLLIDVFLKVGSGLPVLAAAQASGRAGKLVVLSNYATPDIRRRCAALGADRVFDKSSELDELIAFCAELGAGEQRS
jgi:DNA-binding NarL/FixJ family response regulator